MEHPENSAEYAGLVVNKGVEQPSSINPYLKRGRFVRRSLTAGDYVEGILKDLGTPQSHHLIIIGKGGGISTCYTHSRHCFEF